MAPRPLVLAAAAALLALLPRGTASGVAPLAVIAIEGMPGKAGAPVPLRVTNQSGYTVQLRRAITVERWTGKGWKPLAPAAAGLLLRADCKPDAAGVITPDKLASGCVAIGPRATFRSQPWLGTHGDAQCACERCAKVAPGTYRYSGSLCPGAKHALAVHGLAFRLR